jgi:hypothetical protein
LLQATSRGAQGSDEPAIPDYIYKEAAMTAQPVLIAGAALRSIEAEDHTADAVAVATKDRSAQARVVRHTSERGRTLLPSDAGQPT